MQRKAKDTSVNPKVVRNSKKTQYKDKLVKAVYSESYTKHINAKYRDTDLL
jgi:hypothetical protein